MKNKYIFLISYVLAVIILTAGCSGKPEKRVVARVGGEKILLKDVNERLKNASVGYQDYLASESGRRQFIDLLVRQKIMIMAAKKEGINKKKEFSESLENFKKQMQERLRQYEEEFLIETYLKELEKTDLNITGAEIEEYHKKHKKEFASPKEIRLSHILLSSESEAKIASDKLRAGDSFETVAEKHSLDSSSAQKGGDMGSFRSSEILPEFMETVRKLKVGQHSDKPIKTSFGYHLLKKTSEKILPNQAWEETSGEIKRLLLKEKFDDWIERQKKRLNVKIDYTAAR